jgi:thiol-disulfide isomerase/thioredoxin
MTANDRDAPGRAARRRLTMGAVAVVATAIGASWAWLDRRTSTPVAPSRLPLWELEFDTLRPPRLAMAQLAGKPLVINFWATWCPPCIEELPLLNSFFRQNSPNGWQVLGLAVDQAAAVETFLQRNPVQFTVALAGFAGIELSRSLGNLAGGLPFTVALDADGQVIQRKMGLLTAQDLQAWAALR